MQGLFPWLKELLFGPAPFRPHECEEFTPWKACIHEARIVADSDGTPLDEEHQYDVNTYFQERRCTLCGKVFQDSLVYDSHFDSDDDDDSDDEALDPTPRGDAAVS